ncbi:hypothetical protein BU14_0285s0007 [Porphyra umbilicalis]|uniref:Uncharacterized protein n=1 Tax=Porphyra umbilicalis TaxID=2786 RepID=A0A1X6P0X2_PORUM|nr:hypothetical protein BU14_0285s0007 [Porphyra umbilicalis]|eukprot:OSX74519.1 hypothetical protein BU14_0285s0007 [Porphyra umbilicalis]
MNIPVLAQLVRYQVGGRLAIPPHGLCPPSTATLATALVLPPSRLWLDRNHRPVPRRILPPPHHRQPRRRQDALQVDARVLPHPRLGRRKEHKHRRGHRRPRRRVRVHHRKRAARREQPRRLGHNGPERRGGELMGDEGERHQVDRGAAQARRLGATVEVRGAGGRALRRAVAGDREHVWGEVHPNHLRVGVGGRHRRCGEPRGAPEVDDPPHGRGRHVRAEDGRKVAPQHRVAAEAPRAAVERRVHGQRRRFHLEGGRPADVALGVRVEGGQVVGGGRHVIVRDGGSVGFQLGEGGG